MDVVKIKIGREEYDIKDAVVRNWISGKNSTDFEQQVKNIIKYGIADISGKNAEELAQLEAAQKERLFNELDPIFAESVAHKLVATVDNGGTLTLIGE